MILVSPTALGYIPVFLLHLISLGYLLLRRPRSLPAWLFCGWLGGMTFMVATQCLSHSVYAPRLSAYLDWWGGMGSVSLAMVALLQFAYHFPRLRYPREARVALVVSLLITGTLFAWLIWESCTSWKHQLYAGALAVPRVAFAAETDWVVYDFDGFRFGFVGQNDADNLVSYKLFDIWQIVANSWILVVWLRKTIQFSTPPAPRPLWQRALAALRRPQGQEACLSRAWVLLMLLSPFPVLASFLDAAGVLPPGSFATVYLLVLFAIVLTYVNYAPEPTTFMVRLVGISLLTLLVILGLVDDYVIEVHGQTYTEMRCAELQHVRTQIETGRLDALPPDVLYVAARPTGGLFAPAYHLLAARPGAPDAATLAAHDALLREGLAASHHPTRLAVLHEHPWLGFAGVFGPEGASAQIDALYIPEETAFYQGLTTAPESYVVRYSFVEGETRYEVGYSYLDYRQRLHEKSLPLLALMVSTTIAILAVFPRFFHVGLVAPLTRLLQGVDRVNRGTLDVSVPISTEDEIGYLTRAFNRMVDSLRVSEEHLRTLNLTLEQRVTDRTRDLTTLYEIAALINQTQDLDSLFTTALARVVPAVRGDAGAVFLRQAESRQAESQPLSLAVQYGLPAALVPVVVNLPVWQEVFELDEALLVHELVRDPRLGSLFPHDFPYSSLVCVPVYGNEGGVGTLGIFGTPPLLFNVEDLRLLGTVAEQLGLAVENAGLRERAEAAIVLEERQRLARDLHDSVTQLLYSQTLFASAATKSLRSGQAERAGQYLARLGEAAGRALREMRLLIHRLRPTVLAQVGLAGALKRRLEVVEQRAGMRAQLVSEMPRQLAPELEQTLYHIAEEALNNALKHAHATEVRVELRCEGRSAVLCVIDNGCGFDLAHVSAGLGLPGLRERAEVLGGTLDVTSAPDSGTRVVARLPLQTN